MTSTVTIPRGVGGLPRYLLSWTDDDGVRHERSGECETVVDEHGHVRFDLPAGVGDDMPPGQSGWLKITREVPRTELPWLHHENWTEECPGPSN